MRQAGSVVKKRKRYYVVYRTPAGKQKWEGGFDTKGAAQTRLTDVLGEIQAGTHFEPSEMLFKDFADRWLKNRINIEGSTSEGYESYLTAHIKPELGDVKLKDIRYTHVQEMISKLAQKKAKGRENPLSANTIKKMITMLKTLFHTAVKNRLIRINPAEDAELPRVTKATIQPPAKKDVLAILEQSPEEYRPLFLLDAMGGLRRGEVLAVQWRDIDWINSEALIERAIGKARATDGPHKYTWAIKTTKGGRSRRVGLPPIVIQSLQMLRAAQGNPAEDQFIFSRNGTFIDPEYFTRWIALPLVRKATEGRVKRFHDLRHFFASLLIENGESAKYSQDQVGHASITPTFDVYGHLMPQAKQRASKKLEKSLFGKKSNVRTLLEQNAKNGNSTTVN
jgi:integrase